MMTIFSYDLFIKLPLVLTLVLLVNGGCQSPGPTDTTDSIPSASASEGFDAELTGFSYPFPVQYVSVTAQKQALKMAYMDVPPQGQSNGQTVVMLHGKNFSGFYFERMAKDLAAKGFRVVIPDQIGFGKSSKPHHFQYSFAQLSRFTGDLLKSLNIKSYHVLGHSMGGMLATRIALSYSDQVQKLVLINPIGLEDYRTLTSYRSIDEHFANELKSNEQSIKKYQQESYYGGQWKPSYDALIIPAVGWTKGPDRETIAWTSALLSDVIYNEPIVYEFKNLAVPTYLIIGQRDRTAIGKAWANSENQKKMGHYPTLGRLTAKLIPKAQLIELEGMGHVPFIEEYDRFTKAFMPIFEK